jgi:TPR repeat protein
LTDEKESKRLYEVAVEKYNSALALYCLARFVEIGEGNKEQAYEKALDYYRRSAELGNPGAQASLARYYFAGYLGLEIDMKMAKKYALLAAEQENPDGQVMLALLLLTGNEMDKDVKKGVEYLQMAAEENNAEAFAHLGYMYQSGNSVLEQDYVEAFRCLRLANERSQGYFTHTAMAGMYKEGQGTKMNLKLALKSYKLAMDCAPNEKLKNESKANYDTLFKHPDIQRELKLV